MELTVIPRNKLGRQTKSLRKEGLIPAVLYGRGIGNENLAVNKKDFQGVFKNAGENTIITLVLEDGKTHPVLVHDIQRGYMHGEVDHIDFYQVRMDEKIDAPIPIEFVGEAPAVKEFGGVLNYSMEHIEVEALPGDLPKSFVVDVSSLVELNQSIYVKDIDIPAKVKLLVEPDTVVATVTEPMKEEEVVPVTPEDVSAVKVEAEEKKEERAQEKRVEEEG